ncbi:MAG: hypothetical protein M1818_006004 [Claussenomyces sp. TS43310]|nr:MAG: hypothetical protein M1818_006004 [Claussenomyces sp. TS43310]
MSVQNLDFESSKSAEAEASIPTGMTSNGERSAADSFQEKQDVVVDLPAGEKPEYATGLRLFLIMFTISMSGLLTALEIGIIATAIPEITGEFHSISDVGWYGCATFLVAGAFAAMWGKLYKYLNIKYAYLASIAIFLVGSIVAAAAPNSTAVIVGRAIQGWGISGTMSGSIIIINYVSHPKKHPVLIGTWTGIFMVPKHIRPIPATWKEIILQLDLPGLSLVLAALVCLTLAMQWGGQTKAWNQSSVIATLLLWLSFNILFVVLEWFQGARAMVPLKLLKPRVTWANALYSFISNSAFYQVMFYLPIYFQSIHSQSAIISGVNSLPFFAFFALGAVLSGTFIGKTRHLQPYQLTSALLMTAGMALLYTLDIDSSQAWYIGAEVLFGFGVGFGNQVPMMAVQGLSKPEDVASSTGIMIMCQSSSGAYFIVVAQSLFANRMLQTIKTTAPNLDAVQVLGTGASDIHHVFSGGDLAAVLDAYMIGIKDVFTCALAGSAVAVLVALVIPFEKLPNQNGEKTEEKVATV